MCSLLCPSGWELLLISATFQKIIDSSLARALASCELPWVQPIRSWCTCMGQVFWSNPGLNPHPLLVAALLLKPFHYTETRETLLVKTEAKKGLTASALPLCTVSISPVCRISSFPPSISWFRNQRCFWVWVGCWNELLTFSYLWLLEVLGARLTQSRSSQRSSQALLSALKI